MYISNLILNGFKSFPQKSEFRFSQGITSIVGPNGCGKTNVVDALRWVLGEQRTKMLRGNNMQDVIFNGSASRKPSNFAEVSLTVHNNRGVLPIEFNDIIISRRLYRDGTSEYFINQNPCRLKDINDLFMDTGMGTGAYSVIELKMIEDILSDNQEDRRRMFDEAAGINKYRQQRRLTLNKYETTQEDLLRVNDIVLEVQRTVRSLKRQLNRFERYESIQQDLKNLELLAAGHQILQKEEQIQPLKNRLKQGKEVHSSRSKQVNIDESLIEKYKRELEVLESEHKDSQDNLEQKNIALFESRNQLLLNREQLRNTERDNNRLAEEINDLERYKKGLSEQIRDLDSQIYNIKPQLDTQKEIYETKKSALEEKQERIEDLQKQMSAIQNERLEIVENISDIKGKTISYKNQIRERRQWIESAEVNLEKQKTQSIELEAQLDLAQSEIGQHTKKLASEESSLANLQKDIENLQTEKDKLRENISSMRAEFREKKRRLQLIDEIIISGEGFSSGTQTVISHSEKFHKVLGVVADVFSVPSEYRPALEIVLGDLADCLIVQTRADAEETAKTFQDSFSGKISIISLENVRDFPHSQQIPHADAISLIDHVRTEKQYQPILKSMLVDVFAWEELPKNIENGTHVTLDGTRMFSGGKFTVGMPISGDTKIGRGEERELLKQDIKNLENLLQSAEKDYKQCEYNFAEKRIQLETHSSELQTVRGSSSEVSSNLAKWQYALERTNQDIEYLTKQMQNYETDLENFERELIQSGRTLEAKISEKEKNFKILDKREKDMDDEIIQFSIEKEKVHEARITLLNLQNKFNTIHHQKESFSRSIADSEQKIKTKKEQISQAKETLKNLSEKIIRFERDEDQFKHEYHQAKSKHEALQEKLQAKRTEVSRIEAQISDTLRNRQLEMERLQEMEIKITKMEGEIDLIRNHIREQFGIEIPDDLEIPDDFDFTDAKIQIGKRSRLLEQIGPINWAVRDEHDEEKKRLDFLLEQMEDIEKAGSDLKLTMDRLDEEAKTKFEDTFQKVSENFKETFNLFFNGGSCNLSYVDPDDILNSQINITASPPGKRPRGLDMLSSGEKSLTALSLLFAIYLTKPSPFCILDEVDAPLDDMNITQFGNALQQFAETTQFIIVTHNKLTMEIADYMYGVTMETKGVSKVVSVKFV